MRWMLSALLGTLLLLGAWMGQAQDSDLPQSAQITPLALLTDTCESRLIDLYIVASEACIGGAENTACNGGITTFALPQGPVANSLASPGALIPVDQLDAVSVPTLNTDTRTGGLLWMRVQETQMNALLLGGVSIANTTAPGLGFPKWTAFTVNTGANTPTCDTQPPNAFIAQNVDRFTPIRFVANGVSVDLAGTVMIYTTENETVFLVLEGLARLLTFGNSQTPVAGQESRVSFDPADWTYPLTSPTPPAPYTAGSIHDLPIALLDRAIQLPQPGYVTTDGSVNLRTGPGTEYGVIYEVPAGQNMTILGRNDAGDWYHVRLANGQTGWMFAELLRRNHGNIQTVYQSTPVPPQRYGDAGHIAVVSAAAVTLRSAPHVGFPALYSATNGAALELLALSPYSAWIKVQTDNVVGWVPLLNVQTNAILESLPVDYTVPLPPEPTQIPGISGFAFPDPACFPNC